MKNNGILLNPIFKPDEFHNMKSSPDPCQPCQNLLFARARARVIKLGTLAHPRPIQRSLGRSGAFLGASSRPA